jgi:glutamate/tyrosine decarboxylase-like PLP-dependent enzyme
MDAPDDAGLDRALTHVRRWLASLPDRSVPAAGTAEDAAARLGTDLPAHGAPADEVVDRLAAAVEPGLMASPSGRFYGWVMGSTLPVAIAADWLVTGWDQNAGMRDATPGVVAAEEVAAAWLLELLGLPRGAGVGFVTGATMANFTCLAAARGHVLAAAGWDVENRGLAGAPPVRVLAGAEVHTSVELALRYLGLGRPEIVPSDEQGRIDPVALERALAGSAGPVVVCLQAGNVHSGAFDPAERCVAAARSAGAWVHVDGAFGLWALATPTLAHLTRGLADADSWATDAHKTLNTPYDCGVAVVADHAALHAAMSAHASYLLEASTENPYERVPEMSRRARGVPVWAALAGLGADGVRQLVECLVDGARGIALGMADVPGAEVVNDVEYTQVCVAFGSDERTRAVHARLFTEGRIMPSASTWRGRAVIRFSVSSWRTRAEEVRDTVAAVRRAAAAAG